MAMPMQHRFLEEDSFLLDALFCEEEEQRLWGDEEEDDEQVVENHSCSSSLLSVLPIDLLLEQDLFWEDEELLSLLSKEQEQLEKKEYSVVILKVRSEAVEWMLKAIAHCGFSPLTAVLAINYLDRFLSSFHVQRDKPWMIQLVAVTCLSLAAKVEEIHVPLLLDLQVGDAKYVFEAKTIQRMELLVLSTLKWKMHPVTPLSFLDHIVRRLGLKSEFHFDFLRRCELLLLSVVYDSRSMCCLPSVMAAATMMHVIDEVEPSNPVDYQNQLLRVLRMSKDKVDGCYRLILEISRASSSSSRSHGSSNKRKFSQALIGVVDSSDDDNSGDSWSSSLKRSRFMEKKNSCGNNTFASLNRGFAISSPR